ncbi:MAG: hypothetical protein GQ532_06850 [Methylomarinum sp.]|nr:hypothetical protein [Methylomarinum sp.]
MLSFNQKKNCRNISRILLTIMLSVEVTPLFAEYPDVGVFANAVELDDSELEQMRGKFVSTGQISYFGLEMQTQWQTGSGDVLAAGMKMDVSFPNVGNSKPVVNLSPTVSIVTAPDKVDEPDFKIPVHPGLTPGPDLKISSNGLNNVAGVVQSIQAGGDENQINNSIEMDIVIESTSSNNTTSEALNLMPFFAQETTEDGSLALAGANENSIQVYTYVPNQGEIIQRISGATSAGGQIMQSTRVIGNRHRIVNTMTISANFSAASRSVNNNSMLQNYNNFF